MTAFEILMAMGGLGMIITLIKFTTDRSLLIDTINYWKKQFDTEVTKTDQLVIMKDEKISILNQEIISLKVRLAEEKLSVEDLPFIYARMDENAKMIDFSRMYSDCCLRPYNMNPFTYSGKTSEEYWGSVAKEWTLNDRICLRTGESFIGKETLMMEDEDKLLGFVVYKKPGTDKNGKKILHVFIFDDKKIIKMFKNCEDVRLSRS